MFLALGMEHYITRLYLLNEVCDHILIQICSFVLHCGSDHTYHCIDFVHKLNLYEISAVFVLLG